MFGAICLHLLVESVEEAVGRVKFSDAEKHVLMQRIAAVRPYSEEVGKEMEASDEDVLKTFQLVFAMAAKGLGKKENRRVIVREMCVNSLVRPRSQTLRPASC